MKGSYTKACYLILLSTLLTFWWEVQATAQEAARPTILRPEIYRAKPRIKEDCVSFNYKTVKTKRIYRRWKVVDGNHWIMDFGSKRAEALRVNKIIKIYKLTEMCFIGRPDPSMTYFKVKNQAPQGAYAGEDCVAFNRYKLRVLKRYNRWIISDGNSSMLSFGNKLNEANAALATLKRLRVSRQCFVGRPKASMQYYRR